MKSNFSFKFKASLWLAFFLFSLFCQGQNAKAQFGLFDTVWTTNTFAPTNSTFMTMSSNDSLVFLFKKNEYGVPDDTSQKFILFRTLDLNDTVWFINNYPERNLPLKFIENDSKIIFQCKTQLTQSQYINPCIKTRDANTFEVMDSIEFDYLTYPTNTGSCSKWFTGVSEVDTSVYYSGYCGYTAIKGFSYKVNYKTGLTTITSDSLPYFAMTISENGQYVAGVYYTGGTASNVPYNEVIEVRKISDFSLVFRESKYYCDYTSNFYPYSWVDDYRLTLSNNGRFLSFTQRLDDSIKIYDCNSKQIILYEKRGEYYKQFLTFSKFDNKAILKIGKKLTKDYSNMNLTIIDLIDNSRKVLDLPDTTMFRIIDSKLIFNDEYLMGTSSYWKKIDDFLFNGDIVLLKLNFDLNSIQEPQKDIIGTLYPNPTNNYIIVNVQNIEPLQGIEIYNIFGECVLTVETQNFVSLQKIDVTSLPPGVYFVKIGNGKPNKFIVVR
jgi:hypothetical protein